MKVILPWSRLIWKKWDLTVKGKIILNQVSPWLKNKLHLCTVSHKFQFLLLGVGSETSISRPHNMLNYCTLTYSITKLRWCVHSHRWFFSTQVVGRKTTKELVFCCKLITKLRPMEVSGEKRPSSWNSLEKNQKGGLSTQFTKVQTKAKPGPHSGAWCSGCSSWHHPWSQQLSRSRSERRSSYWPRFAFTVTTNERPVVSCPQVPSVPFCVARPPHLSQSLPATAVWLHKSGEERAGRAPLGQSLERQRLVSDYLLSVTAPLSSHLKVVSSPALITDERWVILSWENARMPWPRQSSVGWVESVSFKFRIPYTCGLVAKEKRKWSQFIIHSLYL